MIYSATFGMTVLQVIVAQALFLLALKQHLHLVIFNKPKMSTSQIYFDFFTITSIATVFHILSTAALINTYNSV